MSTLTGESGPKPQEKLKTQKSSRHKLATPSTDSSIDQPASQNLSLGLQTQTRAENQNISQAFATALAALHPRTPVVSSVQETGANRAVRRKTANIITWRTQNTSANTNDAAKAQAQKLAEPDTIEDENQYPKRFEVGPNSYVIIYARRVVGDDKVEAFGYARVSTAIQRKEGSSIEEQCNQIRERCKSNGKCRLLAVCVDDGISGKWDDSVRVGLDFLKHAARAGDKVLVPELTRLARNLKLGIELRDYFAERKIALEALDFNLDTSTPQGTLMFHMIMSMAEAQRTMGNRRISAVMCDMSRSGRLITRPPYGYRKSQPGVKRAPNEIDHNQHRAVDHIAKIIAEHPGISFPQIAHILQDLGPDEAPPPAGAGRWYARAVARIAKRENLLPDTNSRKRARLTTNQMSPEINEENAPNGPNRITSVLSSSDVGRIRVYNGDNKQPKAKRLLKNGEQTQIGRTDRQNYSIKRAEDFALVGELRKLGTFKLHDSSVVDVMNAALEPLNSGRVFDTELVESLRSLDKALEEEYCSNPHALLTLLCAEERQASINSGRPNVARVLRVLNASGVPPPDGAPKWTKEMVKREFQQV